ncbi:MAG: hypothetical protein HY606_12095 [Planctomycetes bacterium]|nr:hypothetical protein [Planctomycetota bacterium]
MKPGDKKIAALYSRVSSNIQRVKAVVDRLIPETASPNNNGSNNTGNDPATPNNNPTSPNNSSAPSNSTFIPDPQTTTQAGSSGNSSTSSKSKATPACYIATAASQNPKSTMIGSLVNMRGNRISANLTGKLFSIVYHKSSPAAAEEINKTDPVKIKDSLLLLMLLISIAAVLSRVTANMQANLVQKSADKIQEW